MYMNNINEKEHCIVTSTYHTGTRQQINNQRLLHLILFEACVFLMRIFQNILRIISFFTTIYYNTDHL